MPTFVLGSKKFRFVIPVATFDASRFAVAVAMGTVDIGKEADGLGGEIGRSHVFGLLLVDNNQTDAHLGVPKPSYILLLKHRVPAFAKYETCSQLRHVTL